MKFTISKPRPPEPRPTTLSLVQETTGEVALMASNGTVTAVILRVLETGKIALASGDGEEKRALGFQLKNDGVHSDDVYTF